MAIMKSTLLQKPPIVAQDEILSMFLYHLENALAAATASKGCTIPSTLLMQADDEDDTVFFENLLKLRGSSCDSGKNITNSEIRRGIFDITDINTRNMCNNTFIEKFQIHAIQSRESNGRVRAISIKLPVMRNDGLLYCISTRKDSTQVLEETVTSSRVTNNAEIDDSVLFDELYGVPAEDIEESCMNGIGQQVEYLTFSSGPLQSLSCSHDYDFISSLPSNLGGTLTSTNVTTRGRISSLHSMRSYVRYYTPGEIEISRMGNNDTDDDLDLFSNSYGECTASGLEVMRTQVKSSRSLSSHIYAGSSNILPTQNVTNMSMTGNRRINSMGSYFQSIFSRKRCNDQTGL
mmetsp:Transcript_51238/g.59852  ORF Transcript_51238/g.59852 Transcript_51238/m.59852 type:complete len:348 (-) Transcript_51238:97-1140(-)